MIKTFQTKHISTKLVIESCKEAHNINYEKMFFQIIKEKTGFPDKVIYSAMEREEGRGYIDYGCSIRGAWPTEKGLQYLNEVSK